MIHPQLLQRLLEQPILKLNKLLENVTVEVQEDVQKLGYSVMLRGRDLTGTQRGAVVTMPLFEVEQYLRGNLDLDKRLAERLGRMILSEVLK